MGDFGRYLKELREKKGYGVNQLGTYSGVSATLISKIENGHRKKPKPETILKLSIALKAPYEELMQKAGHLVMSNKVTEQSNEVYNEEAEFKKEKAYYANLIANIEDPVKKQQAIAYLEFLANTPADGNKK